MKALQYGANAVRWATCKVLSTVTQRVYWSRLSNLRLVDVEPPPLPAEDWVRIRPLLGGVCGTDLTAIFQRNHPASILRCFTEFPVLLGHEGVGVIEEAGPAAGEWQAGRRVVVEPVLSCAPRKIDPPCASCRAGQISLCENTTEGALPKGTMIGWNHFTGGTWCESFVAHTSQLFAVPDEVDDETAALTDPIACSLHAVLRCPPAEGSRVVVIGGGIIGLGVLAGLQALVPGIDVTAVVRHEVQEELARRFGAGDVIRSRRGETKAERYQQVADRVGGRRYDAMFGNQALVGGYDMAFDCIGSGESLTDAMKFVHARGTVVECATSTITVVDTTPLWHAELDVVGCYGRAVEDFEGRRLHTYEVVLELVRSQRLDLSGLLTHTFRLEDYRSAFAMLSRRGSTRLVRAAFDHR